MKVIVYLLTDAFISTEIGTFVSNIYLNDDNDYVITDTLRRTFSVSDYIYARDNGDNE